MAASLLGFVAVIALLTVTPGMDTALILRTAAAGAPRQAWGVVLGIQSGTLIWGVLTAAGVTAIFTASHVAYETLRWVGAAYLVWLGLSLLWSTRRRPAASIAGPLFAGPLFAGPLFGGGFRRGLLTNLLNPKMGAFYVALLPQFIPAGMPVFRFGVLLALIHVVLGTAWSALLVALAHRLRGVLGRPRARRVLDRVTGTVLTAFGVRLALGGP
ncbi:LysE family translocator [Actinoplanes sp. NPDC051494]|uniref:LysE family translocator n=1 Tax=Actinoplanes sp. NPDC051494 TaxID=3363907 RepID=UPI0037AC9CE8